jgi:hypothetical protein
VVEAQAAARLRGEARPSAAPRTGAGRPTGGTR